MNIFNDRMKLAKICHDRSVKAGWWKPQVDVTEPILINRKFNLIHSELAEVTEAHRKDLMSEKLFEVHGVVEELADFAIRVFDLLGYFGNNNGIIKTNLKQASEDYIRETCPEILQISSLESLIGVCHILTAKAQGLVINGVKPSFAPSVYLVGCILALEYMREDINDEFDCDIRDAIEMKLNYNLIRKDHKKEVREAAGGKRY